MIISEKNGELKVYHEDDNCPFADQVTEYLLGTEPLPSLPIKLRKPFEPAPARMFESGRLVELPQGKIVRVRMLKSKWARLDPKDVKTIEYKEGEIYELPGSLARQFIVFGFAREE
jgi:hypothetical protein